MASVSKTLSRQSVSAALLPPAVADETLAEYAERIAMRLALPAGLIIGLLILLLNTERAMVPLMDDEDGFGILAAYSAVGATFIATAIGYALGTLAHNARTPDTHDRAWAYAVLPVSVTYAAAAAAIGAIILFAVEAAFRDLALDRVQAIVLGGGVAGAIVYVLTKQAMLLNSQRLLRTALLIIAAGVYLTATEIDDPEWWHISFSYLGSWDSSAHRIFNITLISGGVLLVVWNSLFIKDLRTLSRHGYVTPRGLFWFQIGLYWVAVGIAFIGLFKTRDGMFNSIMHNLSAYSLAAVLGVMMVGVHWAAPKIKREFLAFSITVTIGLAATLLMAALRVINTVGLEIIAFALGIMWLQSFVVTTWSTATRLEPASYPE